MAKKKKKEAAEAEARKKKEQEEAEAQKKRKREEEVRLSSSDNVHPQWAPLCLRHEAKQFWGKNAAKKGTEDGGSGIDATRLWGLRRSRRL
eukprot:4914649-Amphidinium_carterae.1